MAIESGFFNSKNNDRRYDADDMGRLFDGLISDGIYLGVGNQFRTIPSTAKNEVLVDTGRAWFEGTWTHNTELYPVKMDLPETLVSRYDGIYISINKADTVRKNTIAYRKGVASANPVKPKPVVKDGQATLYCIAYVLRRPMVDQLTKGDIIYVPGQVKEVPFVTGIVSQLSPEAYIAEMLEQFERWSTDFETENDEKMKELYEKWDGSMQSVRTLWDNNFFASWEEYKKAIGVAENEMAAWIDSSQAEFDAWFKTLQESMDDNIAAKLLGDVETLKTRVGKLETKVDENYTELKDTADQDRRLFNEYRSDSLSDIRDLKMRADFTTKTIDRATNLNTLRDNMNQGTYFITRSAISGSLNRPKLLDASVPVFLTVEVYYVGDNQTVVKQTITPLNSDGHATFIRVLNNSWGPWVRNDGILEDYITTSPSTEIRVQKWEDGRMRMTVTRSLSNLKSSPWAGGGYASVSSIAFPEPFVGPDPVALYLHWSKVSGNSGFFPYHTGSPSKTATGAFEIFRPQPWSDSATMSGKMVSAYDGWWKVVGLG